MLESLKQEQQQTEEDPAEEKLLTQAQQKTLRSRVWNILENPETSSAAKVFSLLSLFMIFISVMSTCAESLPQLKVTTPVFVQNPWAVNELVLNSWFLLELLMGES